MSDLQYHGITISGLLRSRMLTAGFGPESIACEVEGGTRFHGFSVLSLLSQSSTVSHLRLSSQIVYGNMYVDDTDLCILRRFFWDLEEERPEIARLGAHYKIAPQRGFYAVPRARVIEWLGHMSGGQITVPTLITRTAVPRPDLQHRRRFEMHVQQWLHSTAHSWPTDSDADQDINPCWELVWDEMADVSESSDPIRTKLGINETYSGD